MKYTAAGDASLMITFNPLFTALLAIPFLGEKMNLQLGGGLLLAVSGVIILFLYSPNVEIPFDTRLLGDLLIAGAALSWAASTILMKKAMTTESEPLSPLHLTVWASVIGLLIMTPWAGYEVWQQGISNPSNESWISILFLAILSTVVSYVWFADGIKTIGAGKSALYVYLVPPFGIISGWLLIDERLGWSLVVSFILIISGVALAQSKESS
jgi:drug/metabolite transporter (DMT)-like permease